MAKLSLLGLTKKSIQERAIHDSIDESKEKALGTRLIVDFGPGSPRFV